MKGIHMKIKSVEVQRYHELFYSDKYSAAETTFHPLEILFCTWYKFYTWKVKILWGGCSPETERKKTLLSKIAISAIQTSKSL